jgi:hypothetical protein
MLFIIEPLQNLACKIIFQIQVSNTSWNFLERNCLHVQVTHREIFLSLRQEAEVNVVGFVILHSRIMFTAKKLLEG